MNHERDPMIVGDTGEANKDSREVYWEANLKTIKREGLRKGELGKIE